MRRETLQTSNCNFKLPSLQNELQINTKGKGNWFTDEYGNEWYQDDNGDWSCFLGFEVDVTPGGSDTSDSDDAWNDSYDDYNNQDYNDYGDYGGGGSTGSNTSGDTDAQDYQRGIEVMEEIANDLTNGTAHVMQTIQSSDGYKVATITTNSILQTHDGVQALTNALNASDDFLKNIGKAVGKFGVGVSAVQTIVGMTDGEISPQDWLSAAGTAVGIVGLFCTGPIAVAGVGIVSVGIGIASYFVDGDSGSSNGTQY